MGTSNARPTTPGCVHYPCKGRPRILKAGKERKKSTYRGTKRTLIQQETKEGSIYRKNLKDRKNRKEQEEDRMNRKEQEEDRMNRKEQEYSKTHPDVNPILIKYGVLQTGAAPAGTAPKK